MMNLANKSIPPEIRKVTEKALSFYPQLDDISIDFIFSDHIQKSVMQAQPRFTTLLGRRKYRTYVVKIRRHFILKGEEMFIYELPEDVLVGWIGHELGHIMDYLGKNLWSMLLFGIGYLTSRSFIISAERVADMFAVNQGLGPYLLTTKDFILHKAGMPESYIRKITKLYVPPEEIIEVMDQLDLKKTEI